MATKTIAWNTGSGNITLTYTGQGNGSIFVSSDENTEYEDREQNINIVTTAGTPEKAVSVLIKQKAKSLPVGTEYNFDYTGSVQEITLPKGRYKLQCWGAEGGTSYGSSNGIGSKGGYSEGELTLTKTTTLFVFVGGSGSRGPSSSLVNGGWNGGGASVGYSSYNSGDTDGYSYPACGGGATDISTVTSDMSYSNGRTNRNSASLLARCIVAGGGAGGSYRHTTVTTTTSGWATKASRSSGTKGTVYSSAMGQTAYYIYYDFSASSYVGKSCRVTVAGNSSTTNIVYWGATSSTVGDKGSDQYSGSSHTFTFTIPSGTKTIHIRATNSPWTSGYQGGTYPTSFSCKVEIYETTSSTSTSSGYSNQSQQGGGTSGIGQYPGTQSAGGNGNGNDGGFGYGGNQDTTGYRYCSGGAGGGWYGGGTSYSDSSTSYVNYTGGGSGFVNTEANASYRPIGYTGLQLDSGSTTAGNTSHPSTSGGTEIGHSGNGYARITVID